MEFLGCGSLRIMNKEQLFETSEFVIDLLKRIDVIHRSGHFIYTSGTHGDTYINKDAIYQYPKETIEIANLFAERYQDFDIDVVIGPALGGIILAQWTANLLTELKNKTIRAAFTEKDHKGNQVLKRGYDQLVKGRKVLIVEDIVNTGKSIGQVVQCVKNAGGDVIAASGIVNRSPDKINSETFQVPFSALCEISMEIYNPEECPLCESGIPINTNLGHGR